MQGEILLESGTNGVEFIEVNVGVQACGINVAKIKEIVGFEPQCLRSIPLAHPSVLGLLMNPGSTHPLIDLGAHLFDEPCEVTVVSVTEFSATVCAFLVDSVNRICRSTWESFVPVSAIVSATKSPVTGTIHIEKHETLVLDLEAILGEVNPELQVRAVDALTTEEQLRRARAAVRLMFVEDSSFLGNRMARVFSNAGYDNVTIFEDGRSAFDALETATSGGQQISAHFDAIVTAIEMPRMDGLTLCRRVKENDRFNKLPVIMFSSLINEQMVQKCRSVGADSCVSKPDVPSLLASLAHLSPQRRV